MTTQKEKDEALETLPAKPLVTMSNALTRASHGLTLAEKRIVAMAISRLDSRTRPPMGDQGVPCTKINAADYAETFDVDLNTAYDQLRAGAKHLYSRSITFYEPAFKRDGKPIEPTFVQMRWVGSVKYHIGQGWVELHWWPKLMTHLVGLTKHFTSYQLQQASALRSQYSWKLLELLSRFKGSGFAEYTIEDFSVSMGATTKQMQNFAKIRIKIIEPAIKELCEKDGWVIEWEPIKAGRKVRAVRFKFKQTTQQQLPF